MEDADHAGNTALRYPDSEAYNLNHANHLILQGRRSGRGEPLVEGTVLLTVEQTGRPTQPAIFVNP